MCAKRGRSDMAIPYHPLRLMDGRSKWGNIVPHLPKIRNPMMAHPLSGSGDRNREPWDLGRWWNPRRKIHLHHGLASLPLRQCWCPIMPRVFPCRCPSSHPWWWGTLKSKISHGNHHGRGTRNFLRRLDFHGGKRQKRLVEPRRILNNKNAYFCYGLFTL